MKKVQMLDLKAQHVSLRSEVQKKLLKFIDSQAFILGKEVELLEKNIADYCNVKHAIGVASGSDALSLSLLASGIGKGDEVITTPFTFFATAGEIHHRNAKPVFVDIDPKTYMIDVKKIEEKITKKTKAIIPVHLYGQCADMNPIMKLAKKYNLIVIEDAAQAIGAIYKNKKACSLGHLACLSFFPSKNLGGYGDGGMVLTNDDSLAEHLKLLRVHGSKDRYYHEFVGCNSRLDALQALILNIKLQYLATWNKKRQMNAKRYDALLEKLDVVTPYIKSGNESVYNQYTIRVKKRDKLLEYLQSKGIGCAVYYPLPLHLQKCFKYLGYKKGDCPITEKVANEVLSLPVYPELTKQEQLQVVSVIKEFMK